MKPVGRIVQFLCAGMMVASSPSFGADGSWDGWRTGDLIFQESVGPQSAAIRLATGSRYTHVGIVRETGGGPHVIEATEANGVFEIPVDDFIARGADGNYAVYRVRGLAPEIAFVPPRTAWDYYNLPYDPFLRFDATAIYSAELVHYAFQKIGIKLGRIERLGVLDIDTPEAASIFLARWQDHPDCRAAGLNQDDCWALVRDQEIVTPASIAEDPKLILMFSTFGNPS
jgi:hypothetical protein